MDIDQLVTDLITACSKCSQVALQTTGSFTPPLNFHHRPRGQMSQEKSHGSAIDIDGFKASIGHVKL